MAASPNPRPTLAEERRELARSRILEAAREVFGRLGPAATMDEIADQAGVARRTLFRHFPTKDGLAAATFGPVLEGTRERLQRRGDEPLEQWLTRAVTAAYRVNAAGGPGLLQFATLRNGEGELGRIADDLLNRRREMGSQCAAEAWRGAGGSGKPPTWLIQIFVVCLSTFTTTAMRTLASLDYEQAAQVIAQGLLAIVTQAVTDQQA
jgi:AcrR family transcriptional regulator